MIAVVAFGGAGAHHVVVLVGKLGDRKFAANATAPCECMAERDAAWLRRNFVGDEGIEPLFRAGTGHLMLGEGREVNDADALADQAALICDVRKVVGAPETPIILARNRRWC